MFLSTLLPPPLSIVRLTRHPSPDPPSEVLDHLVEVYRIKLHFQPLQLFRLVGLRDHLLTSPQFLRWSFLALTLHFSSHEFYSGCEAEAIEFYGTSSRQEATGLALQGIPRLEVLQALSLLVLVDVAGKYCTSSGSCHLGTRRLIWGLQLAGRAKPG